MNTPEYALHCAVADYLRAVLRPEVLWSTIGHGGGGKIRGAKLQRAGLRPGIADLMLSWWSLEDERAMVMWLELKSSNGRTSREQDQFAHAAETIGHCYYICRTVRDVEAALKNQDVPTRGKIAA